MLTSDSSDKYSRERLLLSLVRSSNNLSLPTGGLSDLCDTVELELQKQGFFNKSPQHAESITTTVMTVLHRYNQNMAIQYINSVYRNQPPLELIKQLAA